MVALRDTAPLHKNVVVRDQDHPIVGVGAHDLGNLYERFPLFEKLMSARGNAVTIDPNAIAALGPDLVVALCAAGIEHANNAECLANEKVIATYNLGEQAELLTEVFRVSFRKGVAPFRGIGGPIGWLVDAFDDTGKAQATSSPSPSHGANGMGTQTPEATPPGDLPPSARSTKDSTAKSKPA